MFVGPFSTHLALQTCLALNWRVLRRTLLAPSTTHTALALRRVQRAAAEAMTSDAGDIISEVLEDMPCRVLDPCMLGVVLIVVLLISVTHKHYRATDSR